MSAEHPLSTIVRNFYGKLNVDMSFVCRLNEDGLTQEHHALFDQLSEEVKKRYYGSGVNVPELLEGKRVLDIGCGSGSLVFMLSKLVGPTGSVVGVDFTEGLIETARAQTDFHTQLWGHDEPNVQFRVGNVERMDELGLAPNSFHVVVSNGVFCLTPGKTSAFQHAFNLLKEGGQFYLNDVYAEKDAPEEHKFNETLWSLGTTGSMRWDTLSTVTGEIGFTTPYLTCAAPVTVVKDEYNKMLENTRYACAGWRLFKLGKSVRREAASVTYNGNIPDHPQTLPWDVDLTFQKGVSVDVDAELATILSSSYFKDSFTFAKVTGSPTTRRNQNPFELMDKLKAEGKLTEPIYKIE